MVSQHLWFRQLHPKFAAQHLSSCKLLPALILTLLFSHLSYAQTSAQQSPTQRQAVSPIQQMAQLNAQGQPLQAYQIGTQLLPQLEGEPAFDLHYGVAAIDSGYASRGAFALERVLMNEPTNDYARLELGRAYFILEEDDRAKAEFQTVLDANPPQDVVENVRPYLRAIDSRAAWRETTYSANVEFGVGHDTNILAAPDNDTFFIPLLGGEATLGGTEESDTFYQLRADASISHPIRYGLNAFLSGNASKRENNSDQVNIASLGVQSGIVYRKGAHNIRAALQADTVDVDSQNFRDSVGVNASWQYSLSAQASISAVGQISQQTYNDLDFRDALLSVGSLSYRYQFIAPLRPVATISVNVGKEDADNDTVPGALQNTERDIRGISASIDLTINNELRLTGSIGYEESDYAAQEALFQVVRKDELYRGSLGLAWAPTDNLLIKLDGALSPRKSNIPIVEYDREQISLSVRYMYR